MREKNATRQRFTKPDHVLAQGARHPVRCLREIFRSFHLDEFREELIYWRELALCNTTGCYDDAYEREDLIDFCQECLKLVEALFLVQKKPESKKTKKWKKNLSKESLYIITKADQLEVLSPEERADPGIPIRYFSKLFTPDYAQMEMLSWLEAVVTYEGVKEVYTGHLIFFYQCMEYMITYPFLRGKRKK